MERPSPGKGGLYLVQGKSADPPRGSAELPARQGEAAAPSHADSLAYMCDMIRQMQKIARKGGCSTLAGVLELAFREADLKRREREGSA